MDQEWTTAFVSGFIVASVISMIADVIIIGILRDKYKRGKKDD